MQKLTALEGWATHLISGENEKATRLSCPVGLPPPCDPLIGHLFRLPEVRKHDWRYKVSPFVCRHLLGNPK
jgi:hypothetical protein